MTGRLILDDGTEIAGRSFGFNISVSGEVVFATGMVGYPESLTDPSYFGQILILTYPLIGNYGVPSKEFWESDSIKVKGLIVSTYNDTPSHFLSKMSLSDWLTREKIPALEISDTRFLAQKIRESGAMLGKIVFDRDIDFYDPNKDNLACLVSTKAVKEEGNGKKTVILIDLGVKNNIRRSLLKRGIKVITVPWNFDPFSKKVNFDGILISNGPGDPKQITETIEVIRKAISLKIPILGICFGNQLLALAAGGDTYKLKFGHRSQNQPCIMQGSKRCFITVQNHGFAVGKIPNGFEAWFVNANDGTNEGIRHKFWPFMSVQFHPEASPGPLDTDWIFDDFIKLL